MTYRLQKEINEISFSVLELSFVHWKLADIKLAHSNSNGNSTEEPTSWMLPAKEPFSPIIWFYPIRSIFYFMANTTTDYSLFKIWFSRNEDSCNFQNFLRNNVPFIRSITYIHFDKFINTTRKGWMNGIYLYRWNHSNSFLNSFRAEIAKNTELHNRNYSSIKKICVKNAKKILFPEFIIGNWNLPRTQSADIY